MKTIITLTCMLFCASYLSAQTKYYSTTKTFNENGYSYQCDVDIAKGVTLYNKENRLTYTKWIFKDTGKEPRIPYNINDVIDDTWTKPKCFSIVNNAFSVAEKERTKGNELDVCIYIDSETGKVTEIDFYFTTVSPFATIPVSVYRKIELELKKNIWFTTTAEGKRMNYLVRMWSQEIGATLTAD
ncbi:DUF5043 domain-containing protein [Bacteroides thetaiotaomicron]|uniref:DUF5043 domain-containing protein n=1 Tax=Bacteroides thetaiotaomicron TaxID=818 RepID=A0AAW4Z0S8_BACT4|nr:DUF5043 domain-containing protein [Bacteroides thetaiotaomicron]MCE9236863.1 DUF5043 domain-containing protein [Bacteroides thetaiotaomicron]MCE9266011.1 DUF5043 domain-containing protein [Bacteroides thetaiotaomicron]MCE9275548.1 DUF5043 domain-containing protein [Bacteroides thetaiotaomicron]MCE9292512.1 DUF5043 domain-containing protein [Bacteroides thetaiotaomicron]